MLIRRLYTACRRLSTARPFVVLGIETSCDDTAVGVVTSEGRVLANIVHSQLQVHLQTGGVVPYIAGSLHSENIHHVVSESLHHSGLSMDDVTHVAVTVGPGLAPCLKAGLVYAKNLCKEKREPLLAVHHMEAHALTPRLEQKIPFPYLVLLVSGGHCILGIVHEPGSFSRLGSTLDDSPGEAMDKLARKLGLNNISETSGIPGGAAIEHMAKRGNPRQFPLPSVMLQSRCCNFSFSGLKTAVNKIVDNHLKNGELTLDFIADVSSSFQFAVARHLGMRTHRALQYCSLRHPDVKHLVVSGGVAQNKYIQSHLNELAEENGIELRCPPSNLCSDNGVMIAWTAIEYINRGLRHIIERTDVSNVDFIPRWPLGEDISTAVKECRIPNWKYT